MAEVQSLFNERGGYLEKHLPVARLEGDGTNILSAYASDGTRLGDVGYRPFDGKLAAQGFLFIC